jgi:hypothetical protein
MRCCPKRVIDDFAAWTQSEFVAVVSMFSDQFEPSEPGYGRTERFLWAFVPAFPLRRLAGNHVDWIDWAAVEKAAWIEEYAPEPHEEMESYWLPVPWESPVVLVEGSNGEFYVWDGNHRVGVALTAGLRSIPALVGLLRIRRRAKEEVRVLVKIDHSI